MRALKGHDLVIEAVARLRSQGLEARLCIIGAGSGGLSVAAAAAAEQKPADILFLVAAAFSIAAATFFPPSIRIR